MAVVMRGWSRTASTAVKLATAERIIGYPFKNVHLLHEALDQSRLVISLPKGKRTRLRQRNTRLALVGDAHARLFMAQRWYNKQDLTGIDWSKIATATLSNGNLGHFGFKLGLDECASKFLLHHIYFFSRRAFSVVIWPWIRWFCGCDGAVTHNFSAKGGSIIY